MLIGYGFPRGCVRRRGRRVVADDDTPGSARLTVAARATRGFRPRSLGRRTDDYGAPWKSLTRDLVGRSGRARDLLRAAVPRSKTYLVTNPDELGPQSLERNALGR